jgi:multidrug efflux pump subunit AcrA (membrane-fusion protein)
MIKKVFENSHLNHLTNPRLSKKNITVVASALVILGSSLYFIFKTKNKEAEVTSIPEVYTETVELRDRFDPSWYYAKIGPANDLPVVSEVAGRIEKWIVTSSEQVKKGSPLLTVRPMDSALNTNNYTVRADINGEVGAILYEEGHLIKAGDPLTQLWDTSKRVLQWQVSFDELSVFKAGLELEAFYDDPMFAKSMESLDGKSPQNSQIEKGIPIKVVSVSRIEEQRGLGYQVRAELLCRDSSRIDPCDSLPTKTWVRVLLRKNFRKTIEVASKLASEKDPFLFVIGKDSIAEKREVKLGTESAGFVEIVSGLSVGEVIVSSFGTKPETGKPVSVVTREKIIKEGEGEKAEKAQKKDKG